MTQTMGGALTFTGKKAVCTFTLGTIESPAFSVDVYTCRAFDPETPVKYTKEFFGDDLIEITWKE